MEFYTADCTFQKQAGYGFYYLTRSQLITLVGLASVSKQGVQGKLCRLSPLALALCLCFLLKSL